MSHGGGGLWPVAASTLARRRREALESFCQGRAAAEPDVAARQQNWTRVREDF